MTLRELDALVAFAEVMGLDTHRVKAPMIRRLIRVLWAW